MGGLWSLCGTSFGFVLSQFVISSPWSRLGYVHYNFHLTTWLLWRRRVKKMQDLHVVTGLGNVADRVEIQLHVEYWDVSCSFGMLGLYVSAHCIYRT